MVHVFVAGHT